MSLAYVLTTLVFWPVFSYYIFFLPFFTGRNRNLQGLASSIVKLWEKCEIAKIAVKRGVQNTNTEIMAEELKVENKLGISLQCYLFFITRIHHGLLILSIYVQIEIARTSSVIFDIFILKLCGYCYL